MNITVTRGDRLTPELIDAWSSIQAANAAIASPYFSPGFTRAAAVVRDDVYVAVIRQGPDLVGFFPFQRNRVGAGCPVAGFFSDFHGLILQPGKQVEARELISACGLKIWDFDHLPADQETFRPFQRRADVSRYMDLTGGYDQYCAQRREAGSEQIKKVLALRRKLQREVGSLTIRAHVQEDAMLQLMFQWKSSQYLATGFRDLFSFVWTKGLLEVLLKTQSPTIAGMLSVLSVNGEPAAVHFGMRSPTVWHYWFPAYNTKFAKYSPGLILLLGMAEQAPAMGIQRIDLGKGDELYKHRLASGGIPVMEGSIEKPSVALVARRFYQAAKHLLEGTAADWPARLTLRKLRRLKAMLLRE
jgi:CelD/BcsL family acetyltransferase involved in cellulose biosynthesis